MKHFKCYVLRTINAFRVSPDFHFLAVGTPWSHVFIFPFKDPESLSFDGCVTLKSFKPVRLLEWSVDSSKIRCTDTANEVVWFELDRVNILLTFLRSQIKHSEKISYK